MEPEQKIHDGWMARQYRQRKQWVHLALLILSVFMFFVWAVSRYLNSDIVEDGTVEFQENEDEADGEEAIAAVQALAGGAMASPQVESVRCAILFFGLPRSFESMVLPSMTRHVFMRNARWGCDYFVHYYHKTEESSGRAGAGGDINPDEVLLMKERIRNCHQRVKQTSNRNPTVVFVKDTEEEFWQKRGKLVEKYRAAKDENGHYLYYPWRARTYHYPESLDNIVKQWYGYYETRGIESRLLKLIVLWLSARSSWYFLYTYMLFVLTTR